MDGVYASNLTGAVPADEASDDEASDDETSDEKSGRETPIFMVESTPTQEDVESVVHQARKRILRYLEKRGVITFVAGPADEASGDGEVNAILGDGFGESDLTLAGLLAAAAEGKALTGVSPAWSGAKTGTDYALSDLRCPPRAKGLFVCPVFYRRGLCL